MKQTRVYLDTSVINFLFAEDSPEFMAITKEFFENFVALKIYDTFISDVVIEEINKTQNEQKKKNLLEVIRKYELNVVLFSKEANILATVYVNEKIILSKKVEDARHIAIATINNFDVLLSWNFKHLANINKKQKIKFINEKEGYHYPLDLLTPIQLIYEND